MARLIYNELSKAKIREHRNIVISEACDKDKTLGYSIAEQLSVKEEDGHETKMFMRGGIGIVDEEGLLNLYNATKEACEKLHLI